MGMERGLVGLFARYWMMVWKHFHVDLEAEHYSITNHYNSLCAGAIDYTLPENGM